MLQIAEENFDLKDYQNRRSNALKFYPVLMKSYIDRAMANYVKAIIVNYHNQYSMLKEHEEIFNEMTGGVIYKVQNSGLKCIWGAATVKDMEKDKMYYEFNDKKLMPMNPSFLCSLEAPMLCRALRYGVALKLEDLFTDYAKNIDICIGLLGRNTKKGDFDSGNVNYNDSESSDGSTLCTFKEDDNSVSSSQKYHENRMKTVENLSKESIETRDQANQELKNLEALYQKIVIEGDFSNEKQKLKLKKEFNKKLTESDELIVNMNKYLCFSVENRRFFNVSF